MAGALFVSLDPFGDLMAGPAVRCRELAAACAEAGVSVTVAVPGGAAFVPASCEAVGFDALDPVALSAAAQRADAIVVQGPGLARFPVLLDAGAPLAVDLYCPFLIENLERDRQTAADVSAAAAATHLNELRGLNLALARGDFFLCADPRQRDYWLGALTALHRLSLAAYRDDPMLNDLIATVPFGCPSTPPTPGPPLLCGVVDGIPADAEVILWGGSLSPWFDVDTLLRAMAVLRADRPRATLVLLGTHHPNPDVPPAPTVDAARALAQDLGLLDAGVHFLPWVPYADRGRYLLEAKLGVSTHGRHLEAHFSFRTRLVDYMWARLPMVVTRGDALGSRCGALGAALAVEPGRPEALALALRRGLEDDAWRTRATQACALLERDYAWSRVAEPLRAWLAAPRRAADAAAQEVRPGIVPPIGTGPVEVAEDELRALQAEAGRARDLDARLRAVDRKLRALEGLPGIGRLVKRRRSS